MSLYNEVRPVTLAEVKGQDKIVAQIMAILATKRVPNVSLFVGPRGTGKTTVARIFAKAINCLNPSEDGPCNSCKSCKEISEDNSLDVIELDAASNNKVEDVHFLINSSKYTPLGKYKVFIIDEVHMLSISGFNALLKLLEEPPAHCRFILCTTEEHKIPVTILSRCRKFYFERISTAIISEKMRDICKHRKISYEDDALRLIAKKSEGCMRDAESLLEIFLDAGNVSMDLVSNILGTTNEEIIWNILQSITTGDILTAFSTLKEVKDKGKNLQVFLRSIIEALTDLVYYHQSKDVELIDNTTLYKEKLVNVSQILSIERALEMASEFSNIFQSSLKVGDISFLLETKLLTLIENQSLISKLQKQVECLENALYSGNFSTATVTTNSETVDVNSNVETTTEPKTGVAENDVINESTQHKTPEEVENAIINSFTNEYLEGSILPGDTYIPAGTEIKGKYSLSSDVTIDELPVQIDGFKHISKEEQQENPWNKDSVDNSTNVSLDETLKEDLKEKDTHFSFKQNESLDEVPTFESFMKNFL